MKSPLLLSNRHGAVRALQRGLTMVEILVAMVLMTLVTLATVTLFSVTSQSYKTVDSSQELNDSARFAFELIGQSLRMAGYQEYMPKNQLGFTPLLSAGLAYPSPCTIPPCPIMGFNNAIIPDGSIATTNFFGISGSGGVNASDTLAVTFGGASLPSTPTTANNEVVDCQGVAQPAPTATTDLGVSLFWVRMVNNEPELSCIGRGTGVRTTQPIVRGVETFQVMYAVDADVLPTTPVELLPDRWVSAQNVTDWQRVRAVRVGFVLRGLPGSAQRPVGTGAPSTAERTFYPMGKEFVGASGETDLTFIAPDDGRLRRAYASTFMLRNLP